MRSIILFVLLILLGCCSIPDRKPIVSPPKNIATTQKSEIKETPYFTQEEVDQIDKDEAIIEKASQPIIEDVNCPAVIEDVIRPVYAVQEDTHARDVFKQNLIGSAFHVALFLMFFVPVAALVWFALKNVDKILKR